MKHGTIVETEWWKIKIYAPPREHAPAHVHVLCKHSHAEVKISLKNYEIIGRTLFSRKAVKQIILYIDQHYDILLNAWELLHEKN